MICYSGIGALASPPVGQQASSPFNSKGRIRPAVWRSFLQRLSIRINTSCEGKSFSLWSYIHAPYLGKLWKGHIISCRLSKIILGPCDENNPKIGKLDGKSDMSCCNKKKEDDTETVKGLDARLQSFFYACRQMVPTTASQTIPITVCQLVPTTVKQLVYP